jgi:hypothetical protein
MPDKLPIFDSAFANHGDATKLDILEGRSVIQFTGDVVQSIGFVLVESSKLATRGLYNGIRHSLSSEESQM